MGIEESALSAEEPAEPPICGLRPSTHLRRHSYDKQSLDKVIPSALQTEKLYASTPINSLEPGLGPRTHAYALPLEQLAHYLEVDPQYVPIHKHQFNP
jgi:hypothetical protein